MTDTQTPDDVSADPLGLPRHDAAAGLVAREAIEVLASQFLAEHRGGRCPSIEEYARQFPERAGKIRRLFPLVVAMENWKADKAAPPEAPTMPSDFDFDRLGDCRILREVGRGGMGVVFEAYQDPPGRRVAVKLLPWQHAPDSLWREQFAHEARLAARLRHANIVPVFQYGEEAGFAYYVMPFIVGVGLDWIVARLAENDGVVYAQEIRRARTAIRHLPGETPRPFISSQTRQPHQARVPLQTPDAEALMEGRHLTRHSWKKIAKIAVQTAAALRHAHRQGLLHRDIKPGNILLDVDGVVRITDFGLARQIASVDDDFLIVGTLRYMSPEHLVGSADERSDLYALGITLYELCTLQPAFPVRTRGELKQAIRRGDLPAPRTVCSQLPVPLEAIILKATQVDPRHRYQSADELVSDLLRFVNGQQVSALSRRELRRRRK